MTGNVGLQLVSTDQSANGYDTKTVADGKVDATPVEASTTYLNLLPSLNLNFQVTDDQVVRFAAAKTQSRSRMDDMKPNHTIGFDFDTARRTSTDPLFSAWNASSGNTTLKPSQDIQFDLAYEWYFAEDGILSASYFYKDLQNWVANNKVVGDFTGYLVPGYHDVGLAGGTSAFVSRKGVISSKNSSATGYVAGTEYQANMPFRLMSESLEGLGMIASASFMDGQIDDPINGKGKVPGLSKEVYQLTVYYERGGFEARVAARKRDKYLTEVQGLSLALTPATDLGATLVDAQIGYNFKDSAMRSLQGLTISLQAQNLTNEASVTSEPGDARQIDRYQNFGANYLLGFSYKF